MLFLFLGLSFLFWILIKFSKQYTDVIELKVDYINLPEGKMLHGDSQKNINVTVKTYGFDMIKYHLFKKKVKIDISAIKRKKGMVYYQLSKDLLPQIREQVASDVEVINIQPDSLYYSLEVSKTKEVKVIPDLTVQYESGYNLLGDLIVEPEYISISGPERLIDSITEIATKNTNLTNVNSSIKYNVEVIALSKTKKVNYSVSEVTVSGRVEKFTETKLTLPFEIKNLPKNYSITTFPDKVEVVFQIGLSDYNKINQNDFKISCDYDRTVKNGLTYLIPELISKPSIASEIKIIPNQIEYLIKK